MAGNSKSLNILSSVQSLSRVRLFVTPWIPACQASLSITNSQSSLNILEIVKTGMLCFFEDILVSTL